METGVDVWTPIEHVQSIDLDFSAEPIQISSFTTGRDPEHLYGIRSANVSLSGLFVNPANAPGIDALLTSRDNGENVKIRTSFAGSTIEQTYTVGDLSIEPPYDDVSSLSVDLQSDGEPTINMNASLNTGISKLIDIFATATEELGVVMQLDSGVSFSGNAILTSFGLSIPHDGAIEVSDVTLDGSGALTQA